jgi:hypothetical protein
MECNKTINSSTIVKKCRKCGMDLCESCYKKHGSVCIWCLEAAADTPLWLIRIAKILMLLSPLFGFLVPAPVPIVLLLQTNEANWLWGFVYTGVFLMVFGILLGSAKTAALKSIVVKASSPAAPTPVRDETALLQPAPTVQTTTHVSMAEQPYNPQIGNVQMNAAPLHSASAPVQDNNLVFDIASANANVATPAPTPAGGSAPEPIAAPPTEFPGSNDAQEAPSTEAQAPETAPFESISQPVPPVSPSQDAPHKDDQPLEPSISSLDSQLLGDISGGDQQLEAPIARPDDTTTNHFTPEGDISLQPSTVDAHSEATPVEEQVGDAGEGERVEQPPAEQQQIEQGLADSTPGFVPQEIPADTNAPVAPEQQVPVSELIAVPGDSLSENKVPDVISLDQNGSNLHVEEPKTDAISAEPTPASDSLVFTSIDQGNNGPSSLKCANCGKDLDAADVFCTDCGFDVKK